MAKLIICYSCAQKRVEGLRFKVSGSGEKLEDLA